MLIKLASISTSQQCQMLHHTIKISQPCAEERKVSQNSHENLWNIKQWMCKYLVYNMLIWIFRRILPIGSCKVVNCNFDGLVQSCSLSSALAMEILLACTSHWFMTMMATSSGSMEQNLALGIYLRQMVHQSLVDFGLGVGPVLLGNKPSPRPIKTRLMI